MTLNQRFSSGLQFNGSYTLSKSEDTNSLSSQGVVVQDSTNIDGDFARLGLRRHATATCVSAIWELPFKGNRLKEGWQVAVITQGQTRQPDQHPDDLNFTGNANIRPDLVGDLEVLGNPNQWFTTDVCDPRIAGSCTSSSVFALPVSAEPLRATSRATR